MYVEVLQEIKDAFHFPLTKQTDIKTLLVYINEQSALFCRLLLIVQPVLDYWDDGVQKCQKIMVVSQTTEHLFNLDYHWLSGRINYDNQGQFYSKVSR